MAHAMTKAAFARRMGVHRSRVTAWAAYGMPVTAGGLVNPDQAAAWVHANIDQTARRRAARRAEHLRSVEAAEIGKRIPCVSHLDEGSDAALVAVLPMLMYATPASVISLAVSCGCSAEAAFTLYRVSKIAVMQSVTELLDKLEVPPPPGHASWDGASLFEPDGFVQLNWPSLAAQAGVPLDLVAWQAFSDERVREHFALEAEPPRPNGAEPDAQRVTKKGKTIQ